MVSVKTKTKRKICALFMAAAMASSAIPVVSVSAAEPDNPSSTITPVFADENGLPNEGIIIKPKGLKKGVPICFGIKFNPDSDKNLNTQPDNYIDAAAMLRADIYKYDSVLGKYVIDESVTKKNSDDELYGSIVAAYPDSNNYNNILQVGFVPSDNNDDRIIVIKPLKTIYNGNTQTISDYGYHEEDMSSQFKLTYSIGLLDVQTYYLKSVTDENGKDYPCGYNIISAGTLDSISNPLDVWTIECKGQEKYTKKPEIDIKDGKASKGVNIHFEELPEDFSLADDFYFYAEIPENYVTGTPTYGYADDAKSNILGGYMQGLKVYGFDTEDGWLSDSYQYYESVSQNIGTGSNRGKELTYNYVRGNGEIYNWRQNERITDISIVPDWFDGFCALAEPDYIPNYAFTYKFGVSDPDRYTIEIKESNTKYSFDGKGLYEAKEIPGRHDYTVSIKLNTEVNIDTNNQVYGENGLPNYGVLLSVDAEEGSNGYINITPKPTEEHPTGTVSFAVDYYLPINDELMPYFRTQGGDVLYHAPNDEENGMPYNISNGKWDNFYNKDKEYYLVGRNMWQYSGKTLVTCAIGQTTRIPLNFFTQNVKLEDNFEQGDPWINTINGTYHYSYNGMMPLLIGVHPTNSVKPAYGPADYDFDYSIQYGGYYNARTLNNTTNKYETLEGYNLMYSVVLEDTGTEYNRIGAITSPTFNVNSKDNKMDTITIKRRDSGEPSSISDENMYLHTVRAQDEKGNYIGEFPWNHTYGLMIKASDIIGSDDNVLPYINIDLNIKDTVTSIYDDNVKFVSLIGTIKDNIFYAKNVNSNTDWVNTLKTQYDEDGDWYNIYNDRLSPEYTYTLHAHMDKDDVIWIIPDNRYVEIEYSISMRNHNTYNIDNVTSEPAASISRTVNNNIIYQGSTQSSIEKKQLQEIDITFKRIAQKNSVEKTSETATTKVLPVTLIDYDFGTFGNFDITKQDSEYKFLYRPDETADAAINMWRVTAYPNIVKAELDENGLPVFNYTIPFENLFTAESETDKNGNTKKTYKTNMEFIYDENIGMYSYNSTLHAASFNQKQNLIEMYNAGLGLDNWGMKGAGFYPFNDFSDTSSWGTADKYNLNTALADEETLNCHFGLGMTTEFIMTEDGMTVGKDGTKRETVFNFVGDDDVWVFIDGHLVLDLGGIHEAISGNINFAEGTITTGSVIPSNTQKRSLKAANANDYGIPDWGTDAWAPGTTHTLSMFYLERGGTLSNCTMDFNVQVKESEKYNVTYDSNGGTGIVEDYNKYLGGEEVTVLSGDKLSKENNTFVAWNTQSDGKGLTYNAGNTFRISEDVILYAMWKEKKDEKPEPETYSVVYNSNGGTGTVTDDNKYKNNDTVTVKSAETISREGFTFVEWNTKQDGTGESYRANDTFTITSDQVFYAIWDENKTDDPEKPSDPEKPETPVDDPKDEPIVPAPQVVPKTGESDMLGSIMFIAIISSLVILISRRKRKTQ